MHTPDDIASYFASDKAFDQLYPINIRELSELHWTPLKVAKIAAKFLASDDNARIIDIGAGAGKFCIAGSYYTSGTFTGIEQHKNLVRAGNKVINDLGLSRVTLQHGNFMELDISRFTGIYFFNSFHENIVDTPLPDKKVERTTELYEKYTNHLFATLEAMPTGTRLATYWLSTTEIPACYRLHGAHFNDLLKLWVKEY